MSGRTSLVSLNARVARRTARRFLQLLRCRRLSMKNAPVLFANSFPKSGTHLLTQVLGGFARIGLAVVSGLPAVVTFDGFSGRQRSREEILADLERFLPGDIGYGHVHAFPEAIHLLTQSRFATYFILRDPRDVVLSHVHYIADMAPAHIHHRYYHEVLQTFEERLSASIQGASIAMLQAAFPTSPENREKATLPQEPLPDIRARFEPYLGWLDRSEVLTLRFEDFVNERSTTIERILDHAIQRGFELTRQRAEAVQILENHIDPTRSPTFRSGKSGGWRQAFNHEHRRLFKDIAGDLLIQLGYESGMDW